MSSLDCLFPRIQPRQAHDAEILIAVEAVDNPGAAAQLGDFPACLLQAMAKIVNDDVGLHGESPPPGRGERATGDAVASATRGGDPHQSFPWPSHAAIVAYAPGRSRP